eukprot:TRINITY_DN105454_c0_g1_i1.p2 TRINITY_DN105454_c0_g1~~TRINITY_DN105454_c0_g1_i1.p2  ORF type:complete len:168 (+),score=16.74 TRINITY_DN105454_c0_g1_i1:118-621(+)
MEQTVCSNDWWAGNRVPADDEELYWGIASEVIVRNIPSRCRENEILVAVCHLGFAMELTKFYLPLQRSGEVLFNKGYAFFGFSRPEVAMAFRDLMPTYIFRQRSSKVASVHPVHWTGPGESAFKHALVSVVRDTSLEEAVEELRQRRHQRVEGGRLNTHCHVFRLSL